jgi:uncharacterized protein YndB with AHSA1/START domain
MSTRTGPRRDPQGLTIEVTRQQVWAALTEPEQLKHWFPTKTPSSICDPAAGSTSSGTT